MRGLRGGVLSSQFSRLGEDEPSLEASKFRSLWATGRVVGLLALVLVLRTRGRQRLSGFSYDSYATLQQPIYSLTITVLYRTV